MASSEPAPAGPSQPPGETNASPFDPTAHTKHTQSPNPQWQYGERVETTQAGREWMKGAEGGWKKIEPGDLEPQKLYALMISAVVPRPIAFVSTQSADGIENIAPFSYFNVVTHNPPTIAISSATGPSREKDTAANIKTTKEFTVNIISEPFVENANHTAIDAPSEVDEWIIGGLTREPSSIVKPARVRESAFSMECELFQAIDIIHPTTGKHTTTHILGSVKAVHVRNDMFDERGVIDIVKYKPVCRLGGISYARVGDAFRLVRPWWKSEGDQVQEFLDKQNANGTDASRL